MKNKNLRKLTVTAMLAALSLVLMYLQFPLPFMPPFIKFDFSDLPALIGTFAFGPLAGVVIVAVKNALHLFVSDSLWVGELSNFLLGVMYVLPAGLVYYLRKNRKGALVASLTGSLTMAVGGIFTNWLIIYPLFGSVGMTSDTILKMYQAILPSVSSIPGALMIFNFPFTLVKGLLIAAICFLIYKPLSPILKGKS